MSVTGAAGSVAAGAPGARVHVHRVDVHFGDCDPAGIVFFPNFSRWMDQASLAFFMACGVPPWRDAGEDTRHRRHARAGDPHPLRRPRPDTARRSRSTPRSRPGSARCSATATSCGAADTLLCEGTEVRAFVTRDADDPDRLRAIPVPEDLKAMCL